MVLQMIRRQKMQTFRKVLFGWIWLNATVVSALFTRKRHQMLAICHMLLKNLHHCQCFLRNVAMNMMKCRVHPASEKNMYLLAMARNSLPALVAYVGVVASKKIKDWGGGSTTIIELWCRSIMLAAGHDETKNEEDDNGINRYYVQMKIESICAHTCTCIAQWIPPSSAAAEWQL